MVVVDDVVVDVEARRRRPRRSTSTDAGGAVGAAGLAWPWWCCFFAMPAGQPRPGSAAGMGGRSPRHSTSGCTIYVPLLWRSPHIGTCTDLQLGKTLTLLDRHLRQPRGLTAPGRDWTGAPAQVVWCSVVSVARRLALVLQPSRTGNTRRGS